METKWLKHPSHHPCYHPRPVLFQADRPLVGGLAFAGACRCALQDAQRWHKAEAEPGAGGGSPAAGAVFGRTIDRSAAIPVPTSSCWSLFLNPFPAPVALFLSLRAKWGAVLTPSSRRPFLHPLSPCPSRTLPGMDVLSRQAAWGAVKDKGQCIILTTHDMQVGVRVRVII